MKSLLYLFLFSLVLVACSSPAAVTPLATPGIILDASQPALPPQPVISDTPPPAVTATPTPVLETVDPQISTPPFPGIPFNRFRANTSVEISSIQMFSAEQGWALGGLPGLSYATAPLTDPNWHILFTNDGGKNWADVTPPITIYTQDELNAGNLVTLPVAVYFLDSQHAWISYGVYPQDMSQTGSPLAPPVWRTSDSGATWQMSQPPDTLSIGGGGAPFILTFNDLQNGWLMLGHGAAAGHTPVSLYRTQDGGVTWKQTAIPMDAQSRALHTCCQSELVFLARNTVGLVGSDGGPIGAAYLRYSSDGGFIWNAVDLPLPNELQSPGAEDISELWCTANSLNRLPGSDTSAALIVQCMDGSDANRLHPAYLYHTDDAAQTWVAQTLPNPESERVGNESTGRKYTLYISKSGANTLWLSVQDAYTNDPQSRVLTRIYRSDNGGKSWQGIGRTTWWGTFSFTDTAQVWAVARNNTQIALVHSKDGGGSWEIIQPVIKEP